jgi:hypothetical protein
VITAALPRSSIHCVASESNVPKQIKTFRAHDVLVVVETDVDWTDDEQLGSDPVSRRSRLASTVETLDDALATVTPALDVISSKIKAWSNACAPDEIEAKIGIKLTAEAGAIIARTSAEGNIEITFRWSRNDTDERSQSQN